MTRYSHFWSLGSLCLSLILVFQAGCIRIDDGSNPKVKNSPDAPPLEGSDDEVIKEVPLTGKTFNVKFETTCGDFVVKVHEDWAPLGAQRFYNLVKSGFYDQCRFFRVVPDFMVQFGINGSPATHAKWKTPINDDPVKVSNKRGYVTFATSGPDSRTTQIFVNYKDNSFLDGQGFSPFAEVISGMEVVEKIQAKYGEEPQQPLIEQKGNAYLIENFPELDQVKKATILEDAPSTETKTETKTETPAPSTTDKSVTEKPSVAQPATESKTSESKPVMEPTTATPATKPEETATKPEGTTPAKPTETPATK